MPYTPSHQNVVWRTFFSILAALSLSVCGDVSKAPPPSPVTGPTPVGQSAPPTITTTSLPDATFNVPYTQTLNVTGGAMPLVWGVISGTLPAGLTVTSDTLSFTPGATGTFTFTVRVTDATARFDDQQLTLKIVASSPPAITTSSLPIGTVNVSYPPTTLQATGGAPLLTWQPVGLPFGLQFDAPTATIHGTPTSNGSQNVTFTVNDATVPFNQTGTRTLLLTVNAGLTIDTRSPLPSATVGQNPPYNEILSASGGTGPGTYSWSITGAPATPAPGLTLSSGGVISGSPSAAGSFTRTYRVQDSNGVATTKSLTLNANATLTIDTDNATLPLPVGVVLQPYSAALSASGGTGPGTYTWSLATGSDALPSGLILNPDGTIIGIPTIPSTSSPTFRVLDIAAGFAVVQKVLSITITP